MAWQRKKRQSALNNVMEMIIAEGCPSPCLKWIRYLVSEQAVSSITAKRYLMDLLLIGKIIVVSGDAEHIDFEKKIVDIPNRRKKGKK